MESVDTAEIAFDNVEICREFVGEEKGSLYYATPVLKALIMAINGNARAEYAIEYTIEYMSQREAFGKQ
jgi:alkylation response protein AidB-like acyl-CoA dehydrogenase